MRLAALIAAFIFFVEFIIKTFLRTNLSGQSIPVIENIFHISVIFNTGAAFGMLQKQTSLLIFIGLFFIFIFFLFMKSEKNKNLVFLISCGLIAGGAVSNLYDRIFLGFVVDYIDLRVWPVFNIADSAITCGIILLFWQSFRNKERDKKRT
jgi:signal peptidase II